MFGFVSNSYALMYQQFDLEKVLKFSNGWVKGEITGKSYKKDIKGNVVTSYEVKVEQFSGLNHSDVPNPNSFRFLVFGGVWNNVNYDIAGNIKFSEGDKCIFILKDRGGHFYLSEGAYGRLRDSNDIDFVPHLKSARYKLDDFLNLSKKIFGGILHNSDLGHEKVKKSSKKSSASNSKQFRKRRLRWLNCHCDVFRLTYYFFCSGENEKLKSYLLFSI